MNKLIELRRAKMLALSLLLIAAATFVVTLFLPPNFWVSGVKAIAEAAMVGALADWFAVVALFRRVPIPIISRHTAIIPRNKDRIGENLGQFVQEKFLDTQSLVALIRRHEPALLIGNWFSQPENARRVGQHLLQIMSGFLELTDDARIQRLLKRAVHRAIDKVDLSGTSALMLESMTKNDRHQVLLDTLIAQLIALLQRDKSRKFIAQQIVRWLESEHPLKAKILPTEWLGEHSAELVSDAVNSLLDDISRDRAHQIRHAFDRATFALIDKLKNDPEMAARADAVKSYLKEDEAFNRYLSELWGDLREWLKVDINSEDSRVKERIARAGQWFGETLIADDASRALWKAEMLRLQKTVEERFGHEISEDALRDAIALKNRERRALANFYHLGQLNPPALSGSDILKVVYGATFRFDKEALINELDAMTARVRQQWEEGQRLDPRPRILITGCPIGGAAEKVVRAIEENGGWVVGYENCTGAKATEQCVAETGDVYDALADKYLAIGCSCVSPNDQRLKMLSQMVEEYQVDGVVDVILQACHTYAVESLAIKRHVRQQHNIPYIAIETDYSTSDVGQLSTRVAAFIEML